MKLQPLPSFPNTFWATSRAAPCAQSTMPLAGKVRVSPQKDATLSAYSSIRWFAVRMSPIDAPVGLQSSVRLSPMYSSIADSASSGSFLPDESRNFMPLYSAGLCEALITAPPLRFNLWTAKLTPGVGITPRRYTSAPADAMPAERAASSIRPERLVSLPIAIFGRGKPRSVRNSM